MDVWPGSCRFVRRSRRRVPVSATVNSRPLCLPHTGEEGLDLYATPAGQVHDRGYRRALLGGPLREEVATLPQPRAGH